MGNPLKGFGKLGQFSKLIQQFNQFTNPQAFIQNAMNNNPMLSNLNPNDPNIKNMVYDIAQKQGYSKNDIEQMINQLSNQFGNMK